MTYRVKLISRQEVAKDTYAWHFTKPEGFMFRAGQFVELKINNLPEVDDEGNSRAFSLACAPADQELVVATRYRQTAFKKALLALQPEQELELEGPFGDFTLHHNIERQAVFVIGGIGVTPVISMIKQATYDKSNHTLLLIHSSKTKADLPFYKEFSDLTKENQKFNYVPVLTAHDQQSSEGFEVGRINEKIIKKYALNLDNSIFYLSGSQQMVKAMRQLLIEMKLDPDNIKTEEFPGY